MNARPAPVATADGRELYAVPGTEGLHVTADGRNVYIRQADGTFKQRPQYITQNDYLVVRYTDRPKRTIGVHKLVARTFIGEPPSARHVVARKNGIRTDNRPENLYYATTAEITRAAFYKRNPHIPRREAKAGPSPEARLSPWERAMNEYQQWAKSRGEVPPFEGPRPDSRDFDDE